MPRRPFMLDLFAKLLAALFGIVFWAINLFRDPNHAGEADATANCVRQETERLLASEPHPEPTFDLAVVAREYLAGSRVDIDHVPPRQRFGLLAMKEHGVDPSMIEDDALEAYVRGDHRARGLPDVIDRRWMQEAWDRYVEEMRSTAHTVDDEPDMAPACGM